MPTSTQSSCKYGSGTKWCISGEYAQHHLYHYAISDHKAITFIIDKTRDKKDRLYKIAVLLDLHSNEFVEIRDALDELLVGDEDGIMMLDDYHDDILNFLQNFIGEDLTEKVYKAMQRYGETQHNRISESHKSKTEISLVSWNKIQAVVQKINSEIVDVVLESYHFGKDSSEILSFRDLHREMKENWEDYVEPIEDDAEVSLQFRIKPIRFIALEPSHCISSMLKQSLRGDNGGIFDSIDLNWKVLGEHITIGDILKSRFTSHSRDLHDRFDQYPSGWTLNKIGMGDDYETRLSLEALAAALSLKKSQGTQRYIKSQMNKPEQFRVLYSSTPYEINTSEDYVVLTIREGGDIEDIATAIIESYKYITDALEGDSLGRYFVEFI
jgi:hypothetical protein